LDKKTRVLAEALRNLVLKPDDRVRHVLVIGCGDGAEAAELADFFGCDVDAIDIADRFVIHHSKVHFAQMDGRELSFADGAFDLVYSFHALEHIPQPERVVAEIRRVLRSNGIFIIGVPNRLRLVGYMTGKGATLRDKIMWNLVDWRARLSGRFRNEYGAHAGFTLEEIGGLCSRIGNAVPATREYYELLYPRHRRAIAWLMHLGLWRLAFPCHYFFGRRTPFTEAQMPVQTQIFAT
jgi:SAM-dependent methyltransferase